MASGYPEPDPPTEWEPDAEVEGSAERKLRAGRPDLLNADEIKVLLWYLIPGGR